jgi:hypothetical protein
MGVLDEAMLRRAMDDSVNDGGPARYLADGSESTELSRVLSTEVICYVHSGDGFYSAGCEQSTVMASPRERFVGMVEQEVMEVQSIPILSSLDCH